MNVKTANLVSDIAELTDFKDVDNCLRMILHKVQEHVIGYKYMPTSKWVCVIEEGEHYVKTYEVLKSFGFSTDQMTKSGYNDVVLFPDGKKLSDMVKDPVGFHEWTKENLK